MPDLRIRDVSKTYPNGVHALQRVHLTIPPGMYGLLGPNGAGKSTLMRTIATLQEPDQGEIHLGSIDVLRQKDEVRKTLGYLPQEFGVYPKTTAERLVSRSADAPRKATLATLRECDVSARVDKSPGPSARVYNVFMRIAIIGSHKDDGDWRVSGTHEEFVGAARDLGRALASLQQTIIVGSNRERAADRHIVQAFVEEAESQSRTRAAIEVIRPKRDDDGPYADLIKRAGHLFHPHPETAKWWHDTHLVAVRVADAILTIGGSRGTYAAGLAAIAARKPLVPIASFRGASDDLVAELAVLQPRRAAKLLQLRLPWSPHVRDVALELLGASTGPRILIVHGRSEDWKDLKAWLQQSAGLTRVTVMAQEYGVGETLPEKFERLAAEVDGAIALATPDDTGSPRGETPQNRARQNVWLEVGWFWGKLGRARVLLLTRGSPEIPTDLSGLDYERYDKLPSDCSEKLRAFLLQVS